MVNLYGAESLFKPHIYHSFLLKPGCVKNNLIPVTLSASNKEFASDIQRGTY